VQVVIKHDPRAVFTFSSLQGETGQNLLKQYHLPQTELNSFVLIKNNQAYTRSTAALYVARELSGMIKLLYGFIIVPAFIRNAVYDLIALNRYKWFGKKDDCMVPTEALKKRFLN